MNKEVYSITELMEIGFPRSLLIQILNTEDFAEIGFRNKRKAFFYKEKLEKYLAKEERIKCLS